MNVVVVGGGVVGLMAAYHLNQQGHKVCIVDQQRVGQAASWAGGGILSPLKPWLYNAFLHTAVAHSLDGLNDVCHNLHQYTGINPELRQTGMVYAVAEQDEAHVDTWLQSGWGDYLGSYAWLDAMQLRSVVSPHVFNSTQTEKFLHFPHIYQVRNPRILNALISYLRQHGVMFYEHQHVEQLIGEKTGERKGEKTGVHYKINALTLSNQQTLPADVVVCAAGAWNAQLVKDLCQKAALASNDAVSQEARIQEIRPIKGQMVLFAPHPKVTLPCIVMQNDYYLIPRADGHILCGATLEDVGFDTRLNAHTQYDLHQHALSMLPTLQHTTLLQHWCGFRPFSTGNMPTVERVQGFQNMWLAGGHYRYGLTLANGTARSLVQQINQAQV